MHLVVVFCIYVAENNVKWLVFVQACSCMPVNLVVLFCLLRCAENMSWKDCFIEMYKDFGRYIDAYRPIRKAWDQILSFTEKNCPAIRNSLLGMFFV